MISYKVDLDEHAKHWLKQGVPTAFKKGLIKSARQTQNSVIKEVSGTVHKRKLYPGLKKKGLEKMLHKDPEFFRIDRLEDFHFLVRPSRSRPRLQKLPFKMGKEVVTKKTKTGKLKKIRMNKILTSIYGRPYVADTLNPFFVVMSGGNKGKYFYKGKPKKSETAIGVYRRGDSRYPLETALAPSLSETLEHTPGLYVGLQKFAIDKYEERISKNVDYYINLISD